MAERIQLRRDTAANWEAANPVLAQGEPGYDLDNDILKVGDGETPWLDLDDIQAPGLAAHIGDTDNPHQVTAEQVGADAEGTAASAVTSHEQASDPHSQYVQKVSGKGLSTEDYTTADKDKLAGIEAGAQVNQVTGVDGQTGDVDLSGSYEAKRQNNLTATTDPTADDDETAGYEPLSRWINTSTAEIWLCVDATTGAANWQKASLTLDELGALALGDDASGVPYNNTASGLSAEDVQAAIDEMVESGLGSDFNTMPTVNGDPIVESGSNSDGEWTRWADGTQVCTSIGAGLTASTSASLGPNLYRSATLNNDHADWSFPVPFTSVPSASPAWSEANPSWNSVFAATTVSARILLYSNITLSGISVGATAVGRWK